MTELYPLISAPAFKTKIWGGRRLERYYRGELPSAEKIGEAWIVADLKEGASKIVNGAFAGKSLAEVFAQCGTAIAGPAWSGAAQFPLLIKIIDANEDLSVQVHPSIADCRKYFPDEAGKDESWIILESNTGRILRGFVAGTDSAEFERHFRQGTLERCLRTVPVAARDALRIAPGTVHAMCRGVLALEIQQPSDSTFRIYDYGRLGDDGRPRPAHLEQARRVLDFTYDPQPLLAPVKKKTAYGEHELIIDVPAYRIERISLNQPLTYHIDPQSLQVLLPLDGPLEIEFAQHRTQAHPGYAAILPAPLGEIKLIVDRPTTIVAAGAGGIALLPAG